MNNVVTLKTNVATFLGLNEQRRDVGHECRDVGHERCDVVGFSNNGKLVKIPTLGLLISSKLFFFHNNYP